MYFNRSEDWIGFKIDKRTKYDLFDLALDLHFAAQKVKPKKEKAQFDEKVFFRRYKLS